MTNKKLSMIVPCYNEQESIFAFYDKTSAVLNSLENFDWELIFVNDGSSDLTLARLLELAERDSRVKYISLSRNFGKEPAMLAGLEHASGDYIGFMDADLQHSPELIPEMLHAVTDEGFDVAAAKRTDRKGESKFKSFLSNKFYSVVNKISETKIDPGAQDFRIMKKCVADAMVSMGDKTRFTKGIFSFVGFNTKWFEHENQERVAGETKWNIKKLAKYAIDGIIGFTSSPLRIPLYLGCFTSAVFLLTLICFIIQAIDGIAETEMYIIVLTLLFIGSCLLISIGILGEYLSRVYTQVKNRPIYIISETNIDKSEHNLRR